MRSAVADHLAAMIAADLVPWVPSRGSVGASGDLAPLAHLVLAMMGEGELLTGERRPRAGRALRRGRAGSRPSSSRPRRAFADQRHAVHGGVGAWRCSTASSLLRPADLAGAMSLEALRAPRAPSRSASRRARPIPGQASSRAQHARAARGQRDHAQPPELRQGAGRLLAALHAAGARRGARRLGCVRAVFELEVNSATDNPLSSSDDGATIIISGGNFHGAAGGPGPRLRGIAMAELADISERRIEQLVNPPLRRPAAVPRRRQRPEQRLHDRPGHGGGAGQREQDPLPPGQRRFHPHARATRRTT